MTPPRSRLLTCATALLLGACAQLPVPFTAAQLQQASARMSPGRVLVHYLRQANADPAVCDLRGPSAHLARVDEGALSDLVEALMDATVRPKTFQRCASLLLDQVPDPLAIHLISAISQAAVDSLGEADTDPTAAARLSALHAVLAGRAPADDAPSARRSAEMQGRRRASWASRCCRPSRWIWAASTESRSPRPCSPRSATSPCSRA